MNAEPRKIDFTEFPAYLDKLAEMNDFALYPWQKEMAQAIAEGKHVSVAVSPSRAAAKRFFYECLERFREESERGSV